MATYSWLTLTDALNALAGRLNAGSFWSANEMQGYLTEALRVRNALCEEWRQDFPFTAQGCQWVNLGTTAGSPRVRTVTDADLYTSMQYMLLEQPSGAGTWTGTTQFNLNKFQYALNNRRNEMIQSAACNLGLLPTIVGGAYTRRYALPDTTLETRRVRYRALVLSTAATGAPGATVLIVALNTNIIRGQWVTGLGIQYGTTVVSVSGLNVTISLPVTSTVMGNVNFFEPMTLTREDTQAFQDYNPNYLQENGIPVSWSVVAEPPLSFDVDKGLLLPGEFDVITLNSGPAFAPPVPTLLGVPDDWSWLPMYGALADLLGGESESTDRQRAAYCLKRYNDGLDMFKKSNWLINATVNGQACATPALYEKDMYLPEWETYPNQIPCIVQAGVDLISVAPSAPVGASINLVQNAPILDSTGVYVQVSRDEWDSILDYSQHVAMLKCGGYDFQSTTPLLDDFFQQCQRDNKRVATYGLYTDVLFTAGKEEERTVPR